MTGSFRFYTVNDLRVSRAVPLDVPFRPPKPGRVRATTAGTRCARPDAVPTASLNRCRSTRRTALVLLLVSIAPTAWLGLHHARLEIDSRNESLKSTGTEAASDLRAVRATFGSDQALLLGITAAPGLAIDTHEEGVIEGIAADLRGRPDVLRVKTAPPTDRDLRCLHVTLAADRDAAPVTAAVRAALPPTLVVQATAPALAEEAIATSLADERNRIVPIIGGAMIVLLTLIYRSLRVALLVIAPAGVAIACTGGVFQLAGHALDPISTLLDPVVLTIGIAMNVHIAESYLRHRAHTSGAVAASRVRAELTRPTALSALTTMAGLLALTTGPMPAVDDFGVYAAFGVAIVATLSIWCLPVWLAALVGPPRLAEPGPSIGYVEGLARHRGRLLAAAAATGLAAIIALPAIELDNDPLRILPDSNTFRRQHDDLVRRLGGVETFSLWAPRRTAPRPELPTVLAAIASADERLVLGPADSPLRSLSDGSLLQEFVLAPSGSNAREQLFDRLEDRLADHGLSDVRVVGPAVQIARDSSGLIRSQLASWSLVVPLLGLVVGIGFRSIGLALISLIPNVLPALLIYGGLAWGGRPLSVATVMIGTAMMAVVVDDTIHLLHHYAVSRGRQHSRSTAISHSLRHVTRAMTTTSAVLALGLGVGVFGDLETTVEFSALAAATVTLAWLFDMVLLPALLLRADHRTPRSLPNLITSCPSSSTP